MSLKKFHLFFITLSASLSLILAVWGIQGFRATGSRPDLAMGLVGVAALILLLPYASWFIKKMKNLNPLFCAVCFGDPNSLMVQSTKSGILFLVVLITVVLGTIAAVGLSWSRRAHRSRLG